MTQLLTSSDKGSPLTPGEADANLDLLETRTGEGWRDNIVQLDVQQGNPDAPVLNVFRGNIKAYNFAAGQMTEAFASFHIDHDYMPGTALYPHIHWAITSTATGTVRWGIEYTYAKGHGQMAFGPTTTVYVEQAANGIAYTHFVAEVSDANAIPGTNVETDGIVLCRFFRDGAHVNDTLADDVFVFCVDLHYQCSQYATPNKAPDFFAP